MYKITLYYSVKCLYNRLCALKFFSRTIFNMYVSHRFSVLEMDQDVVLVRNIRVYVRYG